MKKEILIFLSLILTGTFTACKKESKTPETVNSTTPPIESNTDKLCGKNWKITANTMINSANSTTVDLYATTSACLKDNLRNYAPNNTVTENEGAILCSNSSQTTTFNWQWLNNESKLVLAGDTVILIELNATTLKYYSITVQSAITRTYTETWTKQ